MTALNMSAAYTSLTQSSFAPNFRNQEPINQANVPLIFFRLPPTLGNQAEGLAETQITSLST